MRLGLIGSTLGLIASVAFTQIALADDGENDHKQGGHIHGQEIFNAHIKLTPTENAQPASGQFNLQAINRNGTNYSQMEIQTFGLAEGDYTVAAVIKSSGESVSFGSITVGNPHSNGKGDEHGKGRGRFHSANHFRLTDAVDPMDIAQITVSDSNSNADLIGDLVNLAKGSFVAMRANVKLSPGAVAPNATGSANLSVVAVNNTVSGAIAVTGSNLPTNTVLNVTANDQPSGTVTTTKSGSTVLTNLRNVSLRDVNQVTLTDTTGNTAATASF
ncbi:MAG: hypothetical protein ACXWKG_16755 [Limisphaerales bacterium]